MRRERTVAAAQDEQVGGQHSGNVQDPPERAPVLLLGAGAAWLLCWAVGDCRAFMIVPRYWAEGRLRHRDDARQITVRRFGWSDASQEEAQANADRRTREALDRLVAGETLPRRERKVPYNGAEGVPIREEIVSRHGDMVVTRNSYGARCLNVPDVLFADLDFSAGMPFAYFLAIFAAVLPCVFLFRWKSLVADGILPTIPGVLGRLFAALILGGIVAALTYQLGILLRGGIKEITQRRIRRFAASHPDWNLRVYRTPGGYRILVTNRTFLADDPQVDTCFQELRADSVYARMCLRQRCFRARVSPKPWRVGIPDHLKPRPGAWPVATERLPARLAWIERYEAVARAFAACAFVESVGSGVIDPTVRECMELHDALCGANSGRPIA